VNISVATTIDVNLCRAHLFSDRGQPLFAALLGDHSLDVGRTLDPDNSELFTWWPPWRNMRARNIGWRIDYILVSKTLADRITHCQELANVGTSDHAPVVMSLAG